MSQEEIVMKQILEIVAPFAKNKEALANVTPDTSILDDLKVNSARLVDIVLAFEDAFAIEIDDEDADKVRTIGDAARLVVAKIA
jgi:acyl carrier protein